MSYLAGLERADHRPVKATDVQHSSQQETIGAFKWFFCPVTKQIVPRDPPAALSMAVIGTCELHKAPRPPIFCPKGSQVGNKPAILVSVLIALLVTVAMTELK